MSRSDPACDYRPRSDALPLPHDAAMCGAVLPSGTVTFLFTDVEGSTRLLHELGARYYAEALAEHRRALREAFACHSGVEVDTQGDAFFVAFATAQAALEQPLRRRRNSAKHRFACGSEFTLAHRC